jgi:RimJ/RimL family protein N-acetyltransferase
MLAGPNHDGNGCLPRACTYIVRTMDPPQYVVVTQRLGLRRFRPSDSPALAEVFADDYAAKFYPAMSDPNRLVRWVDWNLANYETHGFGLWAVERLADGTFIGDAGITMQLIEGESRTEIGYHIHPGHRSLGYASEAASACLDYGFAKLGATSICSAVHPENIASQKVASRVHVSMRPFEWHSGPFLLYSTTDQQWRAGSKLRNQRSAGR